MLSGGVGMRIDPSDVKKHRTGLLSLYVQYTVSQSLFTISCLAEIFQISSRQWCSFCGPIAIRPQKLHNEEQKFGDSGRQAGFLPFAVRLWIGSNAEADGKK